MKKTLFILSFILLCLSKQILAQDTYTISGYITDKSNGEALIGATVYDNISNKGTVSNYYGFYSLTLPANEVELSFRYIGFENQTINFDLNANKELNQSLEESNTNLKDVVISAERFATEEEVKSTQMGMIQLKPKEIEKIPAIGGEIDLIKVAQLMPGVSRGGEGGTAMYVRGGTDDQNLILLDEATVYNLGHLFGFFSVFTNDAIRDMTIIKGGFPAHYGGRLSSVMDVRMKEGDLQNWHGSGGIGILSSRLSFDGPIVKDKLSIMLSARRTYIDKVLSLTGATLPYFFYDLNAKLTYKISQKDRLFLSTYIGDDILDFNETVEEEDADGDGVADNANDIGQELNFGFKLGNVTSTLRWNHIYNQDKLFHNLTLFQTKFEYDIRGKFIDNSLLIKSRIRDIGMKADWDYFPNPDNVIKFGVHAVAHFFRPNVVNTGGEISEALESQEGELINNQEISLYAISDRKFNEQWSLNYGFRISSSNVPGTFYGGFEPRVSAKYSFGNLNSVKFSYTFMKQYMHRVSSSSIALPTDLWYPVTQNVIPQNSHQIAAGYFKGFKEKDVNLSVEVYYKTMDNLIEYREGARLLLNDNFEEELLNGTGRAYGGELMVRKKLGKFTGWLGYSLSKATRTFDQLNNGLTYSAKYDRRHDISLVSTFDINPRFSFSAVWVMSSGSKFTAQNGQYFFPNTSFTGVDLIPTYTRRNEVTLAPSHRFDVNFILRNKPKKKFKSEWHFGAYNFYNRASPYQVRVEFDGLNYRYVQPGLFGFIPSVAWNFKF
ncbi:MAG: TonB-dependent receptor [Cyclobacteriaceae bacterium]